MVEAKDREAVFYGFLPYHSEHMFGQARKDQPMTGEGKWKKTSYNHPSNTTQKVNRGTYKSPIIPPTNCNTSYYQNIDNKRKAAIQCKQYRKSRQKCR